MRYISFFLFSLAQASLFQTASAEMETKEFNSKDLNALVVKSFSGKITVVAIDGPKASVVVTRSQRPEKCKLETNLSQNKLSIEVNKANGIFNRGCEIDLEVKIPKFADLDLNLGSGNISVTGVHGSLKFEIGSADFVATGEFSKFSGKAGSGDATVVFPKGSKVKTNFVSGSGKLNNELGDTPQSNFLLSMKAGSGDLNVKAP